MLTGVAGDIGHHAALVEGKGLSSSPVGERGDETPTIVPGAFERRARNTRGLQRKVFEVRWMK